MLRSAQVVKVYPGFRQVDLVFQDNGWRMCGAAVLSSALSSDSGHWDMPHVPPPANEKAAGGLSASNRNLIASVAIMDGLPVVVGFVHPQGGQLAFNQDNRSVWRHASGAYHTTAPDGSMEWFHPSGAFVRMGTGAAHEDLAPVSQNGNWKIPAGAASPTFTVSVGGAVLTIDPSGNLTATFASATLNGNVQLNGSLTATGDIKAGSISLENHVHGGVQSGTATTAKPQ